MFYRFTAAQLFVCLEQINNEMTENRPAFSFICLYIFLLSICHSAQWTVELGGGQGVCTASPIRAASWMTKSATPGLAHKEVRSATWARV